MDKETKTDMGGNEMKIYHTETQADYDSLMVELEKRGVKWSPTRNPTETNHWSEFESQTGIKVQDCILTYQGVEYFERANPETPVIKYTAKKETQLPEWANWVARDEDGPLSAFENEPFKSTDIGMWFDDKHCSELVEETDDTFSHIKWTDEQPTSVKALIKEFSDKAESLRELGEALTRNWEAEHGKPTIAEYNQWQITQAKAHGYDEVPIVADKTERVYVDKDGAKITVDETHSIHFEESMALVENKTEDIQYDWLAENRMVNEADEIADKRYETPDIINEPNHYKGKHGIETIDVIRNFGNDDMVAGFYWGNAIKYMTRYRSKNGLEDLKKARKNLDWLIEHVEAD